MKVLCTLAHPDDEIIAAATLYQMSRKLGWIVDIVMVTRGEGGFSHAQFGSDIYGIDLTDETMASSWLPSIRKREALEGGRLLGVRNYHFLEQSDTGYSLDPAEVMETGAWDLEKIRRELSHLLGSEDYGLILTMLPTEKTHGHHKSIAILTRETCRTMQLDTPMLAATSVVEAGSLTAGPMFDHSLCQLDALEPVLVHDLQESTAHSPFHCNQLICNWFAAAHKSQGSLQGLIGKLSYEAFYAFHDADPDRLQPVLDQLERQIQQVHLP